MLTCSVGPALPPWLGEPRRRLERRWELLVVLINQKVEREEVGVAQPSELVVPHACPLVQRAQRRLKRGRPAAHVLAVRQHQLLHPQHGAVHVPGALELSGQEAEQPL
eukprot:scaffold15425_cov110-Isochrysis_galbana.AAC.7